MLAAGSRHWPLEIAGLLTKGAADCARLRAPGPSLGGVPQIRCSDVLDVVVVAGGIAVIRLLRDIAEAKQTSEAQIERLNLIAIERNDKLLRQFIKAYQVSLAIGFWQYRIKLLPADQPRLHALTIHECVASRRPSAVLRISSGASAR